MRKKPNKLEIGGEVNLHEDCLELDIEELNNYNYKCKNCGASLKRIGGAIYSCPQCRITYTKKQLKESMIDVLQIIFISPEDLEKTKSFLGDSTGKKFKIFIEKSEGDKIERYFLFNNKFFILLVIMMYLLISIFYLLLIKIISLEIAIILFLFVLIFLLLYQKWI